MIEVSYKSRSLNIIVYVAAYTFYTFAIPQLDTFPRQGSATFILFSLLYVIPDF